MPGLGELGDEVSEDEELGAVGDELGDVAGENGRADTVGVDDDVVGGLDGVPDLDEDGVGDESLEPGDLNEGRPLDAPVHELLNRLAVQKPGVLLPLEGGNVGPNDELALGREGGREDVGLEAAEEVRSEDLKREGGEYEHMCS